MSWSLMLAKQSAKEEAELVMKMNQDRKPLSDLWIGYNGQGYRSGDAKSTGKHKLIVTAGKRTNLSNPKLRTL